MWCSRWSASTGCTATSTSRSCSTPAACSATSSASSACRSPLPRRWGRSPTRSPRRCAASPATSRCPGWTSARASARTTSCTTTSPGSPPRRGCCSSGGRRRKPTLFRTERRRDAHGESYPWIVKATGVVNQFYVYAVDADFGPFFLKFCSYFPYNAKLCLNGHEWAKRQAAKAGIGFTALDNGFATCADPAGGAGDLRPARPGTDRRAAAQVAGDPAAPVHRGRPGRRLPLRHLHLAGRVLPDPGPGPAGHRAGVLRARHPRQPRHRPPRPDQPDLRPAPDPRPPAAHPGPLPHPGDHRRGHPEPAHRLQAHHDQAVPQGRTRLTDRDHDQRHPRLRNRETADQSARTAGDRPLGQPAPAGRPTTQPQPDPRRRGVHRRAPADHHRHRGPDPRAAPGRPPRPRPAASPADVPAAPGGVRQPRPTPPARRPSRHDTRSPPGR